MTTNSKHTESNPKDLLQSDNLSKKVSHTPRPWYQQRDIWILGPKGETIAQTSSTYEPSQRRHNANLIAAAPYLLAVAKGCLGYLKSLPVATRPDPSWFLPLEQAIAKAEGK